MIAGAIEMTLGLSAHQFLGQLGLASSRLLGFFGIAQVAGSAFQNIWRSIEQGGALTDMSARIGESVGSLYQLQQAFKAVGAGAESVGSMVQRMQISLGAEDDGMFGKLGLSRAALTKMGTVEAINAVAQAMQKVDKFTAAQAAQQIFSREGAATMMMIARDGEGFARAMRESAESARVWQQVAAFFDEIADTVELIKGKIATMWAGIAAGVAPAINSVVNYVNGVDWVGIGKNIGNHLNTMFNIFQDGKGVELMTLAINAGIEQSINFLKGGFADAVKYLAETLSSIIPNTLALILTGWISAFKQGFLTLFSYMLDLGEQFANVFGNDVAAGRMRDARRGVEATIRSENALDEGTISSLMGFDFKASNNATNAFMKFLKENWKPVFNELTAGGKVPFNGNDFAAAPQSRKTEASSLEKIGLILGGTGAVDYNKDTARNTSRMVTQQEQMLNVMKQAFPNLLGSLKNA